MTLVHRLHENDSMKYAATQLIQMCNEVAKPEVCEIVRESLIKTELN